MQDPLKPIPIVSIDDPALDVEAMGDKLAEYAGSRDPRLVVLKTDKKPVIFWFGASTVGYLAGVINSSRGELRALHALLACVHEVELPERTLRPEKLEKGDYGQKVASEAWLATLRGEIDYNVLLEVGIAAIELTKLSETKRRPFASSVGWAATG